MMASVFSRVMSPCTTSIVRFEFSSVLLRITFGALVELSRSVKTSYSTYSDLMNVAVRTDFYSNLNLLTSALYWDPNGTAAAEPALLCVLR